jgi:hypothetical protein
LWNRWILREVAKLIVEHVIKVFESHERWKYSYINVLYKKTYREPFDECLVNPIIEEIINRASLRYHRREFSKALRSSYN